MVFLRLLAINNYLLQNQDFLFETQKNYKFKVSTVMQLKFNNEQIAKILDELTNILYILNERE